MLNLGLNCVSLKICHNYSIGKLACSDILYVNIYTSTIKIIRIYSYTIIAVCLNVTKSRQTEVMTTCVPHVVTFKNLSCSTADLILSHSTPNWGESICIFVSISPAVNSINYGDRTQKIVIAIQNKIFVYFGGYICFILQWEKIFFLNISFFIKCKTCILIHL